VRVGILLPESFEVPVIDPIGELPDNLESPVTAPRIHHHYLIRLSGNTGKRLLDPPDLVFVMMYTEMGTGPVFFIVRSL
jgi:hypothetical protein